MFRKLIQKLLQTSAPASQNAGQAERKEPRFKLGDGYYIEFEEVSNGMGGYRMINLLLMNMDDPSFRRCIIDGSGRIQKFPGIKDGEWKKELEFPLDHKVRFAFRIGGFQDGKALVSWTLQPDGRYFEDEDGFGSENCEEITLYSYIDTNGIFTEPFQQK